MLDVNTYKDLQRTHTPKINIYIYIYRERERESNNNNNNNLKIQRLEIGLRTSIKKGKTKYFHFI